MGTCCTTPHQQKKRCPYCQHPGIAVGVTTMRHHLQRTWQWQDDESQRYYFCEQPNCTVIYFSNTAEIWQQAALRTVVGIKHPTADALVCYCFGVHYAEANATTREYIIAQTKSGTCACTTHNPSGRCCLKDFPR